MMEFSSLRYLLFWSIISQVSILLLFLASDKGLTPLPQIRASIIYVFLPIHATFSSFYAFFLRPMTQRDPTNPDISPKLFWFISRLALKMMVLQFHMIWYQFFRGISTFDVLPAFCSIPWILYFYSSLLARFVRSIEMGDLLTGLVGPFVVYPSHSLCFALSTVSLFTIAYLVSCQSEATKSLLLDQDFVLYFDAESCLAVQPFPLLHFAAFSLTALYMLVFTKKIELYSDENSNDNILMIQIPIVMLGSLLAHYYIQEKSVSLLLTLSSGACYWLANLAMTQFPTDLGILNFLIGAILDCALSLYGLSKFTWIAFAYCIVLGLARWKVKSVTLRHPQDRTNIMRKWITLEKKMSLMDGSIVLL